MILSASCLDAQPEKTHTCKDSPSPQIQLISHEKVPSTTTMSYKENWYDSTKQKKHLEN